MRQTVQILVGVSAVISVVAIVLVCLLGYALLFAPPPEVIQVLPLRLASNPADPQHWDFGNPRPSLHPGDQLVGDFHTCFYDAFGGSTIGVQSRRQLTSFDGSVRAPLPYNSMSFTVGCRVTKSVIGNLPSNLPDGTYRVEGSTLAYTDHYSRAVEWNSVWFDVTDSEAP